MAQITQGVRFVYAGSGSSAPQPTQFNSFNKRANAPQFSATSTYNVGDVVQYSSNAYRCKNAITTAGAWNSSDWDYISADNLCIKDFPDMDNPEKDQIEVTTLCDDIHKYIDGLDNLPEELSFTCNYDPDFWYLLNLPRYRDTEYWWGIKIGDSGRVWYWKGTLRPVLVGAGVGDVLEMRIVCKPKRLIETA